MMRIRRAAAWIAATMVVLAFVPRVQGDDVSVPVDLQVQLLGHVTRYERGFAAASRQPVHVVVVSRRGHAESQRIAGQLMSTLARSGQLGGRRLSISRTEYSTPAALKTDVDRTHAGVVYFSAGFSGEMVSIIAELAGQRVITVSAIGADVDRGAVLGFELVSSRPQIAVNLVRARNQQLQFSAQFLRLARVVR